MSQTGYAAMAAGSAAALATAPSLTEVVGAPGLAFVAAAGVGAASLTLAVTVSDHSIAEIAGLPIGADKQDGGLSHFAMLQTRITYWYHGCRKRWQGRGAGHDLDLPGSLVGFAAPAILPARRVRVLPNCVPEANSNWSL